MLVRKSIFISFISLVLFVFSLSPIFAQAELVAKYQQISGPSDLDYLGIARTKQAYQLMEIALERKQIGMALENFDIAVVKNHTPVCVLDIRLFEDKAKVLILSGLQEGITGWVPLKWVKNDYQKARFWH